MCFIGYIRQKWCEISSNSRSSEMTTLMTHQVTLTPIMQILFSEILEESLKSKSAVQMRKKIISASCNSERRSAVWRESHMIHVNSVILQHHLKRDSSWSTTLSLCYKLNYNHTETEENRVPEFWCDINVIQRHFYKIQSGRHYVKKVELNDALL